MKYDIDLRNKKIRFFTMILGLFSIVLAMFSMDTVINRPKQELQNQIICEDNCLNKKLNLIVENALQHTQKK